MKNFLFVLLCLSATSLFSQIKDYEIGQYFDYNRILIDGYIDFDYDPDLNLKKDIILGEKFTPGYYYDLQYKRVEGYLKLSYSYGEIELTYRPKDSKKRKILKPDMIRGFVLGKDSFDVVTKFDEMKLPEKSKYMEVMLETKKYTLYKYYSTPVFGSSRTEEYVLKDIDYDSLITFPHNKTKLINAAMSVFDGIDTNSYKYKDIPKIFKVYDMKKRFLNGEKLYFDGCWDEVNPGKEYTFYADIVLFRDTLFELKYFFKNGTPIYSGTLSSFYPQKKDGEFTWYYPDGKVRKKANYEDDELKGNVVTFFKNGMIHYVYNTEKREAFYSKVNDMSGNSILDSEGNGTEILYDSVLNRQITRSFASNRIEESYYTDKNGNIIYQKCSKDARLISFSGLQYDFDNYKYPESSAQNAVHGTALVRFIVGPDGYTKDIEILKGIDDTINYALNNLFKDMPGKKNWIAGTSDKKKVTQEIVIPVNFIIKSYGFSSYRNYYYYSNPMWMQQQQMMMRQQQQMMMQRQMQYTPPRF